MNPVERYLSRVAFWLPRKGRSETINAIREALEEQVDAKQAKSDQPFSEAEVTEILRQFGHPAITASRYRNLPPLVQADLMTIFWRVLALGVTAIVLVQGALVTYALLDGAPVGTALMGGLGRAAIGICIGFTVTTLVFSAFGRHSAGACRKEPR